MAFTLSCSHALPFLALAALAGPAAAQIPSESWPGTHPFDQWGHTVAIVGDVDADGTDDVAVASPDADYLVTFPFQFLFNNVGRVVVYSGATGLELHGWTGDLIGGTEFGFAVTAAGDVDGDGFDDVLISAPKADGPALRGGIVELYSGASGALMQTFWGLQTDARFGHSIDGGTDIDRDGILDLLVGSPYENVDGSFGGGGEEGAVRIFSCSDGTLLWADLWTSDYDISGTYPGPYSKDQIDAGQYGASVAILGDLDSDGKIEVASGAPTSGESHWSRLSFSTPWVLDSEKLFTGALRFQEPFGTMDVTKEGGSDSYQAGTSVAFLGTLQGVSGLIASGVPGRGSYGTIEVWALSDSTLSITTIIPGVAGAPLGDVVASIGYVDGDSIPDLLAGSPDATIGFPFGFAEAGLAKVFSSASGDVIRSLASGTSYDHFGSSLAGGDLDGDGLPDVVAGIPGADAGALDVGTAAIYPGHGCVAHWLTYGTGHPGTNGVPGISATSDPAINSPIGITLGNSVGALTTAFLFVGLSPAFVSIKGGTLLVDPLLTITLVLPPGSTTLPTSIPNDPLLCGVSLYLQVAEADQGASAGASFSKGLELAMGY